MRQEVSGFTKRSLSGQCVEQTNRESPAYRVFRRGARQISDHLRQILYGLRMLCISWHFRLDL